MDLGNKITEYRKKLGMTQDTLAQKLGVTNQAVSKWESNQCCPDIGLLPKLADTFGVSIDALFDRPEKETVIKNDLPWENDNTLRVVLYVGHTLVDGHKAAKDITFTYEGPALNVNSAVDVKCGNVEGHVSAGDDVYCGNVGGKLNAGGDVSCGNVQGDVQAGCDVSCGQVTGNVRAGCDVKCGPVSGTVTAGCDIRMTK